MQEPEFEVERVRRTGLGGSNANFSCGGDETVETGVGDGLVATTGDSGMVCAKHVNSQKAEYWDFLFSGR